MVGFVRKKIHNLVSDKKFSEILRGSVWALGAKVMAAVLGMVTYIIIARAYGLARLNATKWPCWRQD